MRTRICAVLLVMVAWMMGGCATEPGLLRAQAGASLTEFKKTDPSLEALLKSSYAYVIFPRVTTGALLVGGAHGNGEVYNGGAFVGRAELSQGSVGLQAGGQ